MYPQYWKSRLRGFRKLWTSSGDYATIQRILFQQCDESITSLGCGRVTNENDDEIIVCTYTGWIFSLSQSNNASSIAVAPQASSGVNVKVQQLRYFNNLEWNIWKLVIFISEIEELEAKVSEERKRYEEMTKKDGGKLAFVPHFQVFLWISQILIYSQVHDHFEFNPEYGAYTLVIELVIPIDFILVQVLKCWSPSKLEEIKSKLPIHLMEVEKNASVVCQIPKSDTARLNTINFQKSTKSI